MASLIYSLVIANRSLLNKRFSMLDSLKVEMSPLENIEFREEVRKAEEEAAAREARKADREARREARQKAEKLRRKLERQKSKEQMKGRNGEGDGDGPNKGRCHPKCRGSSMNKINKYCFSKETKDCCVSCTSKSIFQKPMVCTNFCDKQTDMQQQDFYGMSVPQHYPNMMQIYDMHNMYQQPLPYMNHPFNNQISSQNNLYKLFYPNVNLRPNFQTQSYNKINRCGNSNCSNIYGKYYPNVNLRPDFLSCHLIRQCGTCGRMVAGGP